ncbi:hypothetical protein CF319_g6332 [Tilletia indica]|nr:hypothetical protein CF319_g6332 [Tilletia indica]
MRTARVSSFTFACTTLAVALSASASVLTPSFDHSSSIVERSTMQDEMAPAIVLTPPTPTPDIGIFRLPVTGMHTDPVPYNDGTTSTTDEEVIPEESLNTPPGAGVRPMSPEAQQEQYEKHHGSVAYRVQTVHKDGYRPTAHPLRGDPSIRDQQRRNASPSTNFEASERRDSSGRVHLARVRDFVAKAEYRNRRRSSQGSSTNHAVGSSYRRPSEFASIEVVSSPDPVSNSKLAEADLAQVNVNLGGGLDVAAVVGSSTGEDDSSSSSSTDKSDSSNSGKAKGKGHKEGSNGAKHHGSSSSGSKSKANHNKNTDEDDDEDDNNNKGSSSGSGSGSNPSGKLAKVTWYSGKHLLNPACGGPSPSDHALVAAVNRHSPFASCGDVLTFTSPSSGRSVTVRIVDWCDTCTAGEPWFDLTKGAFEKLADLELGVLKGLEFERVKDHAVKQKQKMMNMERSGEEERILERGAVVKRMMEKVVRRTQHDDLKNSILGNDFAASTGSSLFGVLDLLTGGSSTGNDPPVGISASDSDSYTDSDSDSTSHHTKHKSASTSSASDSDPDADADADDLAGDDDDCVDEDE